MLKAHNAKGELTRKQSNTFGLYRKPNVLVSVFSIPEYDAALLSRSFATRGIDTNANVPTSELFSGTCDQEHLTHGFSRKSKTNLGA